MAGRKLTQCYNYPGPPLKKPFNLKRDMPFIVASIATTVLSFVTAGFVIGFIFGPVGAAIGAGIGLAIGITAGVADTIVESANKWLNQRLLCLGNPRICAVGTITFGPRHSKLGALDNDEFFDLLLM